MEQDQTDAIGDLIDGEADVPEAPAGTADAETAPEVDADVASADADSGASDDITVASGDIAVVDESGDSPTEEALAGPAAEEAEVVEAEAPAEKAAVEADAPVEKAAEEKAPAEAEAEAPAAAAAPIAEEEVADEDALFEEEAPAPRVQSPYDRPGRWYVVHTQSGHEKKAQKNLAARTASMNMEEKIYETVIPMEDVAEFRNGKKVIVQKKMFPGYLLVRAEMNDDAWYVIRNTPSIVNFVGSGGKPSPLLRREVENFLHVPEEGGEAESAPRTKARLEYGMGETVRVKEGPFADFSGEIVEINEDQLKVKVLVNIFGRETPVELEFSQIARL